MPQAMSEATDSLDDVESSGTKAGFGTVEDVLTWCCPANWAAGLADGRQVGFE
jgi:hypothetical protein